MCQFVCRGVAALAVSVTCDGPVSVLCAKLGLMTTREKAHQLLDELPESEIEPVVEILASRGDNGTEAEMTPEQKRARQEAIEFLRRLDSGEDDRFDWAVSERLHASR